LNGRGIIKETSTWNITYELIPHFYNSSEILLDRRINNYANYLGMQEGLKKLGIKIFNNTFRGWEY